MVSCLEEKDLWFFLCYYFKIAYSNILCHFWAAEMLFYSESM